MAIPSVGLNWPRVLACVVLMCLGRTTSLPDSDRLGVTSTDGGEWSGRLHLNDPVPSSVNKQESDCECGVAGAAKIVDGTEAAPHEFPWMAYLVIKRGGRSALCGGFLVSDRHVITAAHCTKGASDTSVQLTIATNNPFRQSGPTDDTSLHLTSVSVIVHPDYDGRTNKNDIAVVTFGSPVIFSDSIRPICLPAVGDDDLYVGRTATVAGWGTLSEGGDSTNILMKGNVPILDNDDPDCRKAYGDSVTAQMICAGGKGTDTCQGDSGGPLMVSNSSIYTAVGIVSFGVGCGRPHIPGVYARLTSLMTFVSRQIADGRLCQSLTRQRPRAN